MTLREAKVVGLIASGTDMGLSLRLAGFPTSVSLVPGRFITDEMKAEIKKQSAKLVKNALDKGLVTAEEIHEYLTDAIRANFSDIRNDDGSFKPLSEWPPIWQQMVESGDVEIEYSSVRSHDGEDKDQAGGWDRVGKILKVKYKFGSKVKFIELAMKHKGVNAMVQEKQGDVHLHLHAEIVKNLQGALAREQRMIEAKDETK